MNILLKVPRRLHDDVLADLHRPHAFAYERVGFLLARWAWRGATLLVIPFRYLPVADDRYIDDHAVGFRIDRHAITAALQATLDESAACLHVHAHSPIMPTFGSLDLAEQRRLIPSFFGVAADAPHGALVVTGDTIDSRFWLRGGPSQVPADRVAIVGHPLTTHAEAA